MTRNTTIIIVVLASIFFIGLIIFSNTLAQKGQQETAMKTAKEEAAVQAEEAKMLREKRQKEELLAKQIKITLKEENNSGESGMVLLKERDGKTDVSITIVGSASAEKQPAHIHEGSCPDVGSVLFPLSTVENGKSETSISATIDELKKELPLAINIHASVKNSALYVACGNFPASQSALQSTPFVTQ